MVAGGVIEIHRAGREIEQDRKLPAPQQGHQRVMSAATE